jgi:23S rRNA-/tRNA-specific pseudouridylate synthase
MDRPLANKIYKCFSRHALHAHNLAFVHPVTNQPFSVVAPLPEDFSRAVGMFCPGIEL